MASRSGESHVVAIPVWDQHKLNKEVQGKKGAWPYL